MTRGPKCFADFKLPCDCSDPGCPGHKGQSVCHETATARYQRTDMADRSLVCFCDTCGQDAMESGVFVPAFFEFYN